MSPTGWAPMARNSAAKGTSTKISIAGRPSLRTRRDPLTGCASPLAALLPLPPARPGRPERGGRLLRRPGVHLPEGGARDALHLEVGRAPEVPGLLPEGAQQRRHRGPGVRARLELLEGLVPEA